MIKETTQTEKHLCLINGCNINIHHVNINTQPNTHRHIDYTVFICQLIRCYSISL